MLRVRQIADDETVTPALAEQEGRENIETSIKEGRKNGRKRRRREGRSKMTASGDLVRLEEEAGKQVGGDCQWTSG